MSTATRIADKAATVACMILALPSFMVLCLAVLLVARAQPLVRHNHELVFRRGVGGPLGWLLDSGCLDYLPRLCVAAITPSRVRPSF